MIYVVHAVAWMVWIIIPLAWQSCERRILWGTGIWDKDMERLTAYPATGDTDGCLFTSRLHVYPGAQAYRLVRSMVRLSADMRDKGHKGKSGDVTFTYPATTQLVFYEKAAYDRLCAAKLPVDLVRILNGDGIAVGFLRSLGGTLIEYTAHGHTERVLV
jgi:hypothetical protein